MADGAEPGRGRLDEATRLAAQVAAFARYPGAAVHVVAKGSDEWRRYAYRTDEQFRTVDRSFDVLTKGLTPSVRPGADRATSVKEHSPVWQAAHRAREVFNGKAEHAVVAAVGDSALFTAVGFTRSGDELTIVEAGSTHPDISHPATARVGESGDRFSGVGDALSIRQPFGTDSGVPSSEQLGAVAWYSVNVVAAREARSVKVATPSEPWRGPEPEPVTSGQAEPNRGPFDLVQVLTSAGSASRPPKTADREAMDVEDLAATTTNRLPGGRMPFVALNKRLDPLGGNRAWAKRVRGHLDSGLTLTVAAEGQEQGDRSVFVNDVDGTPRLTATIGRSANGDVQLRDHRGAAGNNRHTLLYLMAFREAAELGVGMEEVGGEKYTADREGVARIQAAIVGVLGDRLDDVPRLGLADAGEQRVTPDQVAETVARFRDAGGDVVRLVPGDPQYEVMRQQVNDKLAEALEADDGAFQRLDAADRAVDPRLTALHQVFHPPVGVATESGQVSGVDYTGGTAVYPHGHTVAVALGPDGEIRAAAGYRRTQERILIDTVADLEPDGGAAVTAAIVDGPYLASDGRPVGGFVSPEVAAAYGQAGARIGGQTASDLQWLTSAETSGATARDCVRKSNLLRPGQTAMVADRPADYFRELTDSRLELAVLDHASALDWERAEHVLRSVEGTLPADPSGRPSALGSASDRPHRVTVAAVVDGEPRAYATVDSRAGQPIEVIDQTPASDRESFQAIQWWLVNHHARSDREMRLSADLLRAAHGPDADLSRGEISLDQSKRLVSTVRNRLGDQLDRFAVGAGSDVPTYNGSAIQLPAEKQQLDQSTTERPKQGGTARDPKRQGPER